MESPQPPAFSSVEGLRHAEQYRLLVESITDYAIYMLDPDGRVASWNAGAQRFKGYEAAEILGEHFSRFYTEADRQRGMPAEALRIAAAEGRFEREGPRIRKDGSEFWAHVVIDPIRNDDGQLIGFAKITRDISKERDSQKALAQAQQALFQSQKMEAVGQLTGGIAHDFNNLLTVIMGGLESIGRQIPLLPESPTKARITQSRGMAFDGASRAATLTKRLLAFTRQQPLAPSGIDANRLVSEISEILQRTVGEATSLELVQGADLWLTFADPNQLENALLNLAVNARDAMPDGGRLIIETANATLEEADLRALAEPVTAGEYVSITVTDTGTGMEPAILDKAFEPFFTTKPLGHGTGLGLSQVYGFVRQSFGHIEIHSKVGEGTTVKIFLPRHKGTVQPAPEPETPSVHLATRAETILVVEDDEALRGYATEILRELGYRVVEAENGAAALDIIEQMSDIDLLFTDVVMPGGMNGRQLADAAVVRRPDLKVLFTTGYTVDGIVHDGRLDSGIDLIGKPYSFEQLAAKIRASLDTQR